MGGVALGLYALYLVLAFGLRTVYQRRLTGSSGFHGISGAPGSAGWTGGALFVVALVLGVLAPVLDLIGVLDPVDAIDGQFARSASFGLFWGGLLSTLATQFAMGKSWRIGVDQGERTDLVTEGPFAAMRNPIFTAMIITAAALVLLVPNVVAIVGLVVLVIAVQIQARLVEEPYLLRSHGADYASYAARVGRFIPLLGRLKPTKARTA